MQNSYFSSTLGWFRSVAIAEGISYLVLLFVAMPLKYFAGMDYVVKYTGWVHGLLFIVYGLLLVIVWNKYKWKFNEVLFAFIASLIPAGTFVLEKRLKRKYSSYL